MDRNKVLIKKINKVIVPKEDYDNHVLALSLNANIMSLGYTMSKDLFESVSSLSQEKITELARELIPVLKNMVGDDVEYKPMYPNFPKQVMNASDAELYWNAIIHYWTFGRWTPEYHKEERPFDFENVKFVEIKKGTNKDFAEVFALILESNNSISNEDKEILRWCMNNVSNLKYPDTIPFKENLCFVAESFIDKGFDIDGLITNATDILRVATAMSDGDVSLSENTKFRNLRRKERRILTKALEKVISVDDINRNPEKWKRLFHNLHVGEYSNKVWKVAKKFRENQKIETFNSKIESYIASNDLEALVGALETRPGDFARRLDHVLRLAKNSKKMSEVAVADRFASVCDKVSTRVLTTLYAHISNRTETVTERVVFPKGMAQKSIELTGTLEELDKRAVHIIQNGIYYALSRKFSQMEDLGKVWIDEDLKQCPIPKQERSASDSLMSVARGTRMPIGEDNTLRFFIYWIGRDIDLSASFHDENMEYVEHVSYTNLRTSGSYHSGDITSAPNGASEFIDVDIDKILNKGIRYVAMNVYVFSGPTFVEHEKCYAGWMTRSKPKSNEIYDPKTVKQKVDVKSETKNYVPVIFDLKERKAIWADMTHVPKNNFGTNKWLISYGNNIEANKASASQTIRAMISMDKHMSLYDLFEIHARSRGEIVENREDADTVFSLYDGDVTPFDINTVNSRYVV